MKEKNNYKRLYIITTILLAIAIFLVISLGMTVHAQNNRMRYIQLEASNADNSLSSVRMYFIDNEINTSEEVNYSLLDLNDRLGNIWYKTIEEYNECPLMCGWRER